MAGLLDAFAQYIRDAMPGGVLNSEFNQSNANRIINDTQRGLLESSGINARDKRRAWNKGLLDAVSGSDDTMSSINQQAFDSVMNIASIAPMGITAWHGSPHRFDKFDLSKIGTGEGAQAYGHGLYMAESPKVAQEYMKVDPQTLLPPNRVFNGKPLEPGTPEYHAGTLVDGMGLQQARNLVSKWIKEGSQDQSLVVGWQKTLDTLNAASKKSDFKVLPNKPNLYKVDIPDEAVARMLDWDKPLSQQPAELLDSIKSTPPKDMPKEKFYSWVDDFVKRGKGIGDLQALYGSPVEFSSVLARAGIPGIKYLDAGSRGAGGGTSNYVLFSDQLPRIIERNGIETGAKPWAPGEWESFNQGLQK